MSVLSLNNVKKSYKLGDGSEFPVLKGINVSFDKGELVSIIGESGSGKSTLMNIIGGLDSKFEGEVLVDGKNIGAFTEKELDIYRKNKIGFIFQSFNRVPTMTSLENVELPLIYRKTEKKKRHTLAVSALEMVGLSERMNHRPFELSGGQQQRVAIARAIATEPPLILADEPTGNLDAGSSDEIMRILSELHNSGKTVVIITHDNSIAAMADKRIEISDGRII